MPHSPGFKTLAAEMYWGALWGGAGRSQSLCSWVRTWRCNMRIPRLVHRRFIFPPGCALQRAAQLRPAEEALSGPSPREKVPAGDSCRVILALQSDGSYNQPFHEDFVLVHCSSPSCCFSSAFWKSFSFPRNCIKTRGG